MKKVILFVKSMRLKQWVKNVFIFAPMIFSLHFFQFSYLKNSLLAFVLFSLVTGSIYIFNDCFDRKLDMAHPTKRNRPIASGELSYFPAIITAILLLILTLFLIYIFNKTFFIISLIYVVLNVFYSSYLKKIVILDVMIIAIGFVLRVMIGGEINGIYLSAWILIITFLLAIFLGLIKRRQELINLENTNQLQTQVHVRETLKQYNISLLDQLISITTSTTLISYIIYILNPEVQEKFASNQLYLTIPFVAFGIFRYLYLTYSKNRGENPADVIFSDLPFALNSVLWLLVFVFLIYH